MTHKATPEQWEDAGAFASDTRACLLELRDRIAAAEREIAGQAKALAEVTAGCVKRIAAAEQLIQELQTCHNTTADAVLGLEGAKPDHLRGATKMVATDAELVKAWDVRNGDHLGRIRHIYDMGRQHGAAAATCPHIATSDEGTSYCRLAEHGANSSAGLTSSNHLAKPDGSPAPASGLVERVAQAMATDSNQPLHASAIAEWSPEARAAILAVAEWLDTQDVAPLLAARWLREEVERG